MKQFQILTDDPNAKKSFHNKKIRIKNLTKKSIEDFCTSNKNIRYQKRLLFTSLTQLNFTEGKDFNLPNTQSR